MNKLVPAFTVAFIVLLLCGCPLPYQYTAEGYASTAASDPSTPDISAAPTISYSESSGGSGSVASGGSAQTSSDTTISLVSSTVGAVIYYTTDGSTPDPRGSNTYKYSPTEPIALAVASPTADSCSASVKVSATAIGPNMKPSLVSTATLSVQYPQAAAPTFSVTPGAYTSDQYVSLSSTTEGASIYYTVTAGNGPGATPVPGGSDTYLYSSPIQLSGPDNVWTVVAIAVKDQLINSTSTSSSYSIAYEKLATPVFDPSAGTLYNTKDVTITGTEGATIYYTTDGSDPDPDSPNALSVSSDGIVTLDAGMGTDGVVVLKAIAVMDQMADSSIASGTFTFQVASVSVSVASGTYNNAIYVSLSTNTSGATIKYTTDDSDPATSATAQTFGTYTGQTITIIRSMTFRAVGIKDGYLNSAESSRAYVMKVGTPTFNYVSEIYAAALSVEINCVTTGATIKYTTDGTDPSTSTTAATYSGTAIALSTNGVTTTLKAYATFGSFEAASSSATYTIAIPGSVPTIVSKTSTSLWISVSCPASATTRTFSVYMNGTLLYGESGTEAIEISIGPSDITPSTSYIFYTKTGYNISGLLIAYTSDTATTTTPAASTD